MILNHVHPVAYRRFLSPTPSSVAQQSFVLDCPTSLMDPSGLQIGLSPQPGKGVDASNNPPMQTVLLGMKASSGTVCAVGMKNDKWNGSKGLRDLPDPGVGMFCPGGCTVGAEGPQDILNAVDNTCCTLYLFGHRGLVENEGGIGVITECCVLAAMKKAAYPAGDLTFGFISGPTRATRIRHDQDYERVCHESSGRSP